MKTYNIGKAVYVSSDLCLALSPIKQCKNPTQYYLYLEGEQGLPSKVCEYHMKRIAKYGKESL